MISIGIIGNGFVGKALQLITCNELDIKVYDIRKDVCKPLGTTLDDINKCDIVFICVPTPLNHSSDCYTDIVSDVVKSLTVKFKVVRSTVPIGYCDNVNCYFMPEFLTEANWKEDFINTEYWYFGIPENMKDEIENDFKTLVKNIFNIVHNNKIIKHNNVVFIKNKEAESLKIIKNTFLASKVSIMNEINTLCERMNIDWNNIKHLLAQDNRIGNTHLNIPGNDGLKGFGGTCFPKDTISLYSQLQNNNIDCPIFENILYRNDYIDRIEREWINDKYRTTLPNDKPISLVTGGAGFIGSNLCKYLLYKCNHIVICMDNFETGKIDNIAELKKHPNFLLKTGDVCKKQFFPHIDYIWHLACPASPPKYQLDGYKTLQTCLLGTMNMLELWNIHKKNGCKLLFTSTSEVYGDALEHPQKENYWGNVNPIGPRSCYDEGKRCAETLIYEYRNKYSVYKNNLKIVRIFNTFGPNMDINDGRIITNCIKSIINKKPITIYGDGNQTRSFCYIDDMINGLTLMMNSDEIGPINLGNPNHEISINKIIKVFEKILNRNIDVIYEELPIDDPKQRKPDISLAINRLNWKPTFELEDSLLLTYNHFTL